MRTREERNFDKIKMGCGDDAGCPGLLVVLRVNVWGKGEEERSLLVQMRGQLQVIQVGWGRTMAGQTIVVLFLQPWFPFAPVVMPTSLSLNSVCSCFCLVKEIRDITNPTKRERV